LGANHADSALLGIHIDTGEAAYKGLRGAQRARSHAKLPVLSAMGA
jgi:hypothetical protein